VSRRRAAVVDIEADGLLDVVGRVHCVVVRPVGGGEPIVFHDAPSLGPARRLSTLQAELDRWDIIVGHNFLGYDEAALRRVLGVTVPREKIYDTQARATVVWPDIKQSDYGRAKRGLIPGSVVGQHSLRAWGYRLANVRGGLGKDTLKGEYAGGWEEINAEMVSYCVQDTAVTEALYHLIEKQEYSPRAFDLEQPFASIIARTTDWGFYFDVDEAVSVEGRLRQLYDDLFAECTAMFPAKVHTYKRPPTSGPNKGKPSKLIPFNPNSPLQVSERFKEHLGWKPRGKKAGSVDSKVLEALPYPEAAKLLELRALKDRLGNISGGEKSWLQNLRPDGRVPSRMFHNGTQTSRCRHSIIVNVPKAHVRYGGEMRGMFTVPRGKKLVGVDAKGLELRCLGHVLFPYDGGEYAEQVVHGDPHARTQKILELESRDVTKTFTYALIYGAMDPKLGAILGGGEKKGAWGRARVMNGIPGWKELMRDIARCFDRGFFRGPDGRITPIRHKHAALNTKLQMTGAVAMKAALVIFERLVVEAGMTFMDWGIPREETDVGVCTMQHDEWQSEVREGLEDRVAALAVDAIRLAGESLNFNIPLDGDAKIGTRWIETH